MSILRGGPGCGIFEVVTFADGKEMIEKIAVQGGREDAVAVARFLAKQRGRHLTSIVELRRMALITASDIARFKKGVERRKQYEDHLPLDLEGQALESGASPAS